MRMVLKMELHVEYSVAFVDSACRIEALWRYEGHHGMVESALATVGTAVNDTMVKLFCFRLIEGEEMVRLVALSDISQTRNLAGKVRL